MRLDFAAAIHVDSPFNKLKAALNYDSHVVDERENAPVSLTSRTLSDLIEHPSKLSKFIQDEFMWTDGSRISLGHAKGFAMDVCVQFRTSAGSAYVYTTPTVDRCCRAFLAFLHCVWVSRTSRYGAPACQPLVFSMLAGAHEHRCAMIMAFGPLWTLRRARRPRVSVHRPPPPRGPAAHPNFVRGTVAGTPALPRPLFRGGAPAMAIAQRVHHSACTGCCILVHRRSSVSVVRHCTRTSVATATHDGTTAVAVAEMLRG